MKEFCNKKRKREENELEEDFTIPMENRKIKKIEINFPQVVTQANELNTINNMNINIIESTSTVDKNNNSFNKDKNSISTLQSKNDQISSNTNNSILFKVINLKEKQNEKENKEKIQNKFEQIEEEKMPRIKAKSFVLDINIKRDFLSISYSSYSSNNYYNSSHYSNTSNEDYYPYTIGEILENQFSVINYLFNFIYIKFFILQVVRHISDGTFGRVLEIQDINNKKSYACKILLPKEEIIKWWKFEKALIDEIMNEDKNNESNCVRIYKDLVFTKNNVKYCGLIFELLGLSLYEYIKMNAFMGFNIVQIQKIAYQLLQGINFLHKINIIHTDLKPENILFVNSDYEKISNFPKNVKNCGDNNLFYCNIKNTDIRIIDFGSGIKIDKNKHSYGIINTRQYRAPEVILQCCPIDEKTDIWSIGCILYELYTGELLFPTHSNEEQLCLIQKACGHYPDWMIRETPIKNLYKLFNKCSEHKNDFKINIEKCVKRKEIKESLEYQMIVGEFAHQDHKLFDNFIKFLLNINPRERPSASEALDHDFFKYDFTKVI